MNKVTNINNLNSKPQIYYSHSRTEMLKFIPNLSKRILDIGCGEGLFASILKQKFNSEVWGIEINNAAARLAERRVDRLLKGDVTDLIKDLPKRYFDCVVFNDILEHLADPFNLLLKAKDIISEKGVIVCSLPNVRYCHVLKGLIINKQWRYEDCGVLDKTHLRFFTKKSIMQTFRALDYEILTIEGINSVDPYKFFLFNLATLGIFNDSKYMQFACVARPKKGSIKKKYEK